jgi:D-tyrosyl-tRNA(Tyr) deacylase
MKALIQRVKKSKVTVDGKEIAAIDKGLNVLLGVGKGDSEKEAGYIAEKIANLRIFEDSQGKMNLSAKDINGEVLLISQFTLYANTAKGRRPSFVDAAEPEEALKLFEKTVNLIRQRGMKVKTGVFGAHMVVEIENDGPVTILIDTACKR